MFDSYASTGGGATAGGGAKVGGGGRLYGVVNLVGDYHPEGLEETTPADLDGILKGEPVRGRRLAAGRQTDRRRRTNTRRKRVIVSLDYSCC